MRDVGGEERRKGGGCTKGKEDGESEEGKGCEKRNIVGTIHSQPLEKST